MWLQALVFSSLGLVLVGCGAQKASCAAAVTEFEENNATADGSACKVSKTCDGNKLSVTCARNPGSDAFKCDCEGDGKTGSKADSPSSICATVSSGKVEDPQRVFSLGLSVCMWQ